MTKHNKEVEDIIAQARAEALAIIEAAKEEAKKVKPPKAQKAVKQEVLLTAEELEALEAAKVERQEKLTALNMELINAKAEVDRIKGEIKELSGKVGGSTGVRGPTGVGNFIKQLITEGLTNEEILERVATEWPTNTTNANCVNWYRNALKNWPDGKRPKKVKETIDLAAEEFVEAEEMTEDAVEESVE